MGAAMVDVRCPNGRGGGLLFRVRRDPDVTVAQPGNVIEVRCRECSRAEGRPVAHQWSPVGEYLGDG